MKKTTTIIHNHILILFFLFFHIVSFAQIYLGLGTGLNTTISNYSKLLAYTLYIAGMRQIFMSISFILYIGK